METLIRVVAFVGAIVVGTAAVVALKNDWATPGIENHVTKLLLALMAIGCVFAILGAAKLLPVGGGT